MMDARKPMAFSLSRFAGHAPAARPLARPALRRLLLPLLAATALAAIGGALVGRLTDDVSQLPARPAAPAEPGLFDFPSTRQHVPLSPAEAGTAPLPAVIPPTPLPAARVPAPQRAPAIPAGVERFDSCRPACDSRDPARSVTPLQPANLPPAAVPVPARAGVPIPPRAVGETGAAAAGPGLMEQTVTLTRDAVSGLTSQADQWADQVKAVFVPN
ncbi:MAG: hypothetical protein AB1592_19435 [Pseudomonadota bacterium]